MAEPGTFAGEVQRGVRSFRGLHWGWHLLIVAGTFLFVAPSAAGSPSGGFLGFLVALVAFVVLQTTRPTSTRAGTPEPQAARPPPDAALAGVLQPYYCTSCGDQVYSVVEPCPRCGAPAAGAPAPGDFDGMVAALNHLVSLRRAGLIDAPSFERIRSVFESRLKALRPQIEPPVAAAHAAPAAAGTRPGASVSEPAPTPEPARRAPAPPKEHTTPVGEIMVAWAAERQADILLYLGAFLISMAAVIFVAYQGEAVSPIARVAILSVYALAFLMLGLLLHRWERTREAGPIFLALGAILVPITFASALRVNIVGEERVPRDVLWLIGSTGGAALYLVLAGRGYGWYYVLPAIPALLVAWGAVASVIGLPGEWWGAWYQVAAAALYVVGSRGGLPAADWMRRGGVTLGMATLLFAAAASASDQHHWQLAATFGLASAALGAGLRYRRSILGMAVLPLTIAVAAGAANWASTDPHPAWFASYLAAAGAGYLLLAHFDARLGDTWRLVAFAPWIVAIAALAAVPFGEGPALSLPAGLAVTALGVGGGVSLWRMQWRPGVAALPAVTVATLAAFCWAAFDMPWEWSPAWVAVAGAVYLLPAAIDRKFRDWCPATALGVGLAGIVAAFFVAAEADSGHSTEFVLPATLGIAAIAVAGGVARWRLDWRPGIAALPSLVPTAAGTLAWAWLEMPPEWTAPWVAAAAAGYLVPGETDRAFRAQWQTTGLVFGAVAAFLSLTAATGADVSIHPKFILPVTLAVLAAGAAAGVTRWRLTWRPGIATLPALLAATPGALAWAWAGMSPEWATAWVAAAAAGYLVPAEFDRAQRVHWRLAALGFASVALLVAHTIAADEAPVRGQLPLTYGIVFAASLADAARRRDAALLFSPALGALLGATFLWAIGVAPEWWAVPALTIGAGLALAERVWDRGESARALGWSYVAVLAVVPTLLSTVAYQDAPGHGLAACAATAVLLAAAAVRARGAIGIAVQRANPGSTLSETALLNSERAALVYVASAFALGAAGYFNDLQGIGGPDRAWAPLGLGVAAWLAGAATALRSTVAPILAVPPALVASSLAAGLAAPSPGTATVVLAVSAVMPALAFASTRFPPFWLGAGVYASLAVWAFWNWAELPTWTLSVPYALSAVVAWAALFGARRYGRLDPVRDTTVHSLSWAPWALAGTSALLILVGRSANLESGERLLETPEWLTLVAIVAGGSAAITAEGWRLRNRFVQQVGTAGLLLSLLMTIGIGDPSNVQAYTVPIGLYIIVTALSIRRSTPLFGRHMNLHEGLIVLGVLFIVLPPAEQGFSPGGEVYGFELIGIGLALLFLGLVLHARWLVPCGVLTVSGVAVRWLTGGFVDVPFWLILGLVGTALLGAGTFILLQRERWDAWRKTLRTWWFRTAGGLDPAEAAL